MSCNCLALSFGILMILFIAILLLIKLNLHRISNARKVLLVQISIFLTAMMLWPTMIFTPKDYRNLRKPFAVLRRFGEFVGFEVEVRGAQHIKPEHGGVVIINHQSVLDLYILGYLWPILGPTKIVVKKSLLFYPFFGMVLWLSGFLFIDRKRNAKAVNKLNAESSAIQEDNFKLLIFPEGTRHLSERIQPFRKGAFHIAIKSQCPIQPIVFSHYRFLTSPVATKRNRIIISILPQIETKAEFTSDANIDSLIDKCRDLMQTECTQITNEIDAKAQ